VRKQLAGIFWRPYVTWYISKARTFGFRGLTMRIEKGVFHPSFFFSTRYLVEILDGFKDQLPGKSLLELGAGSGLLSLLAARYGARVTASDLNKTAVATLIENAAANKLQLQCIHSDLFQQIPAQCFDFVLINPPYFKKNPATDADLAWYCGENMEYFRRLFATLRPYLSSNSECLMILAENCDLQGIQAIATSEGFAMNEIQRKKIKWEMNFIFKIVPAA
jgi:release factor glutamine methyltransferase